MGINIGSFLSKRAMLSPRREGMVCDKVRLTFDQMNRQANRLAHALQRMGIKQGDRVGLLAFNEAEFYDLFFGLGKIGAILVPINYRLAGPEIAYILNDCGAKVFVFGKEFARPGKIKDRSPRASWSA